MERTFGHIPRDKTAYNGFTLIELLVVIAIIALLVSILLPSLQKAKQLAKSAVCMSNLRSSGTLVMLYAQDYDGVFQVYWDQTGTSPPSGVTATWAQILSRLKYVEGTWSGFICPSYPPEEIGWWIRTYGARYGGTSAGDDFEVGDRSSSNTMFYAPDNNYSRFLRVYGADRPADYLFLADTRTDYYAYATPELPSSQFYAWFKVGRWKDSGIDLRHSNATNGWFLDSHVESCNEGRLEDVDVVPAFDGDGNRF